MKEEYKNNLFKKYADLCVDKKIYKKLENDGIIYKGLRDVYTGFYGQSSSMFTRSSAKLGKFNGIIPTKAASYNEILFLENWINSSRENDTCVLVYRDFMVICSEPKMEVFKKNLISNYEEPVAIPLSKIVKVSAIEKKDIDHNSHYGMKIEFENGQNYYAFLFTRAHYSNGYGMDMGTYLQGNNWSFQTNQLLGHNLSYDPGDEELNQNYFIDFFQDLINNCTDYEVIENAIIELGCNTKITKYLLENMYNSKINFVFKLIDLYDDIKKENNNPELIKKLERLLKRADELTKKITEYNGEIQEIRNKINKKNDELLSANLFKKIEINKEINNLKKQIKMIEDDINNTHLSEEDIDSVYDLFIKGQNIDRSQRELAIKLYDKCIEKNIDNLNDEDNLAIFNIICNSMNIGDDRQELFEIGRKNKDNKKDSSRKEILLQKINDEESYNFAKKKTLIVGKDKYALEARAMLNDAEAKKAISNLAYQIGVSETTFKAKKSDEYILGGIANGIAGGAAALATVSDIRSKNAQAEIDAASIREHGYDLMRQASDFSDIFSSNIYSIKSKLKKIDEKLCDVDNTAKYYDYLDCKISDYVVNQGGELEITVDVKLTKEPKLKDIPIIIDGSLLIEIYSGSKKVGDAYLVAPGLNVLDTSKIGFNVCDKYSVIGLPLEEDFVQDSKYDFIIKPINVWMIEK